MHHRSRPAEPGSHAERVLAPLLPAMAERAAALDEAASFPAADVDALRDAGLFRAPLPVSLGGEGLGTEPAGAAACFAVLRAMGGANPAVGRVFEAHVNALQLIMRFGSEAQQADAAARCAEGRPFGLWVTDAPGRPLRWVDGVLDGAKGPCSGAGHVRDALVTVGTPAGGVRMAVATLRGDEPVVPLGARMHGMRAAANGFVTLDRLPLPASALLGGDGDYLVEPGFSGGAWRTMAVTLGIVDALLDQVATQLRARGHDAALLQQARFGELLIARGTARLWTWEAAMTIERPDRSSADQVATVNLARIAVENACLDAARLVQRALGLGALARPNAVERLLRDLATYLRQPAPDMVLTEAAQHVLARA